MKAFDVSIIMVNWKVADLVLQNVKSLFAFTQDASIEVIVVDNNSADALEEKLRETFADKLASGDLVFIQSGANLGFAKGNNLGARAAHGDFLLFMNPDMEVLDDSISKVWNYYKSLEKKKRGALGAKLQFPDRTVQPTVKRHPGFFDQSLVLLKLHHFLYKHWPLKKYFALDFDYEKSQAVEQLMGAFIFIDKDLFWQIGGWPEAYWIWWEDVDLCKSIEKLGRQNYYYTETNILHYEGKSFAQELSMRKQWWFTKSMMTYFARQLAWYNYWQLLLLGILLPFSFLFTFCIQLLKMKAKGQAKLIQEKKK